MESSPWGLVRPRLLEDLSELRGRPLALVVAPAGAGKTTLLAQYASGWDGPVGWWRVDPADSNPATVARCLWQTIPGLPPAPVPADPESLVAALRGLRRPQTLVVIDDMHRLSEPAAETALETVVVRGPDWLHVLAGGRRLPGFSLARYELSEVCVIDGEHLRFRSWEAERLLRDVYGEPLPPDSVAALARRVGGWAAGLHMFHLSTRNRPLGERRRAVAALDGSQTLTRAYLAHTVLAELPGSLREFLVRTCVFDVLTVERCDRLLGGPSHSQQYLRELERCQAFTASTDGGRSYRYHEVLRAHLAVTLADQLGDVAARGWHLRAAELLRAEGAHVEAARAYARAEDWDRVRELLHHAADGEVDPWQELLPDWLIAEDPWLMLAKGRHLLAHGRLAPAVACLRGAEQHFLDEQGRARCRWTRRLAAAWLTPGVPPPGHWSAGLREATRRHPAQVAAEAGADGRQLVRGVGHLLAGDVAAARGAVAGDEPDGTSVPELGVRVLRACFDLADGWPAARRALGQLIADAEWARQPWLVRLARAAGALDGSAQGRDEARAVVRECDRDGDLWGATLAQAAVCLGRSAGPGGAPPDPQEAHDLVRRCERLDAPVLQAWAAALCAVAAATADRPGAVAQARRAERLAVAANVPGARTTALAAAARSGHGRFDTGSRASGLPAGVLRRWAGGSSTGGARAARVPPVEVYCLGGFRISLRGEVLDLSAVKPRTRVALRLLAVHAGRPVHRETLLEGLWPGVPTASATRSLHVTLSNLRAWLQAECRGGPALLLARDGDAYELVLGAGGYCDVAAFQAAVQAVRRATLDGDREARVRSLRTAVFSYGGDLLPEDGPAEWVVHERETLRRQAVDAAVALASDLLAGGELGEAVAGAERCVQIDRYCDAGWRLLVDGYRLLGNQAAAARARREYMHLLASLDPASAASLPRASP